MALGVGVGLLGLMLDGIGYRANQVQSVEKLSGLLAILTLLPAGFAALSGAMMAFCPIDTALHARLVKALARRARTSEPATGKA